MTKHQIRTISPRNVRFLVNSALCGAAALIAQPAMAGTLPGIPGTADITVSTGGSPPLITFPDAITLQIDLNAPRTVINWSSLHISSGDAMNFLFDAASDIVLNKTTSQIAIDNGGVVTGTVGAATGGNIWFYSPQGVIVSPGANMSAGGFLFSKGTGLVDANFVNAVDPTASLRAASDALIRMTTISAATSASINSAGDVVLSASSGALSVQTAVGNTVQISTTSGSITASEVTATTGAAIVTAGGPGATVTQITGATGVTVSSDSNTSVGAATTTVSGDILLTSSGSASLTLGNSARDLTLSAPQVFVSTVDAARSVFITGTTQAYVTNRIFAGDDIEITANGDVTAGGAYLKTTGLGAVDDAHILLRSTTGSVNAGNTLLTQGTGSSSGDITISAATTATLGTASSSRDIVVSGTSASLANGSAVRDIFVTATNGNATVVTRASAGDDVEIIAIGGNVLAGGATLRSTGAGATDAGQVLARSTGGSVAVGTAQTQGSGAAAGDITVSAATSATLGSASSTRDLTLTGNSSLNLTGDYNVAGTASLVTAGAITQSAGSLTATTLNASGQGGIDLGQANNVSNLGSVNAWTNDLTYRDADSFTLSGPVTGLAVSLTSDAGAINQSGGSLTATTFTASAANGITLTNVGNNLSILGLLNNSGSGDIAISSSNNLVLGSDISAVQGLSLSSGGTIAQTAGVITAGSLGAQAAGGISLTSANLIDSLSPIQSTGSGNVTITNAKALSVTNAVTGTADISIQTITGAISTTSGAQVLAGGDVTLIGADGFSGALGSLSGISVSVTATTGDALVGQITTSGGDATVEAQAGAATLRNASVISGTITVAASGNATLGGDSLTGIANPANSVNQSGTGIFVTSSDGDARVFLQSLNSALTSVSANASTGTASIGLAGDFTVNSVSGRNVVLNSSGTIDAASISVSGGDYAASAQDWAGVALNPGGTIRNLTISDIGGGLVLANALTANGDLRLSSSAEIDIAYGLTAGGDIGVITASGLTIAASVDAAGQIAMRSRGGMTFASTGTVRAGAAGDAVVLASDGTFNNGRGADAVTVTNPAGRWLIYTQPSGNPTGMNSNDNFGGLQGKNFYGSAYDFAAGTFSVTPNAGNRFVHAYQPTLTVTPVSMTVTYDGAVPTLSSTITGLINGDLASDAWNGSPLITGAGSNAGLYTLIVTAGGLASDLNYAFAYGTGTLQINPKALTVTAFDASKVFGQGDPILGYSVSGDVAPGDAFTGALSRVAGESPGQYAILPGTLAPSPNYTVSFNGATFFIQQIPTNDSNSSAILKYLLQSPDVNLDWDPAPRLTVGGNMCSSEDCQP